VTAEPDLPALMRVFESAQRLGFLGPKPVAAHLEHARAFTTVLEAGGLGPSRFLDLGSGGGVPGLVLAACWPEQSGTLLDSSGRRTAFLRRAVADLGWSSRVAVVEGRAEALAREPGLRGAFPLVVARSFAAPAVTAEVGGAFLIPGGRLAVSEPAGTGKRWSPQGLGELGLALTEVAEGVGARVAVISRITGVADRWPRAVGIPTKRPLW
jgi:16S rRNA (guanine527-N7)-methyltransferase